MFWTEVAAPAWVIRLARTSTSFPQTTTLGELASIGSMTVLTREVRLHLASGLQLILPGNLHPEAPLSLLLPLDSLFEDRTWAAQRLWALTRGQPSPPLGLTPQQRDRLAQMLRAVDGRDDGASHRRIAEALFGADRVPRGDAWKGSDLRSRTIRLVADGLALVRGGYRRLLRWRRRRG